MKLTAPQIKFFMNAERGGKKKEKMRNGKKGNN
jgi:hypothetical protein